MRNLLIVLKGISGIFIQSIILREIFSNFFGNELSFSIIISIWLLGGATGTYLFRRVKNFQIFYTFFTILEIIFIFSLLLLLRIFSNIQISYISNLRFFLFSFLISFFSGFFEGARFILLSFLYQDEKSSGKVYGFEGIGFLIGGFFFSLFLFFRQNTFFLLFLSFIFNLLTVFYFKRTSAIFFSFLAFGFTYIFKKN